MDDFKSYLVSLNLAVNTINAYVIAVKNYFLISMKSLKLTC